MPVQRITSSENVDVGILLETVSGTLEQAAYDKIQTMGAELEFPSDEAEDNTTGDHGGPLSKRTTSRGGNASFPAHLRFGGNRTLLEAALRNDYPAEVTIVGTSDIDLLTAGTHNDGSTGLQIKAPTTDFDALLQYNGNTTGGAKGMLIKMEGWANGDNNQWIMVKDVWDNATNAFIDVYGGYAGGAASDPFGAPKVGETLVSATLRAGAGIRNMQSGSGVYRTYSVLVDYFEQTLARFQALRGWMANDVTFSVNGKGEVTVTVNGIGRGWSELEANPQNGETPPAHFNAAGEITNQMYIGGKDFVVLAIVPFANAAVATEVPILLSDAQVSQVSIECQGGVQAVDDIVGTDEIVPRSGRHNPSGSIGYYQASSATSEQISQIGSTASAQLGAVHAIWKDDQDRYFCVTQPKNNFRMTGPSPGASGNPTAGTLEYGSMAMDSVGRAFHVQEITG